MLTPMTTVLFIAHLAAVLLAALALWSMRYELGGKAVTRLDCSIPPALAVLDPAPRSQVHLLALKRFFLVVWHAMVLTIAAGYAMVFGVYGGFANLPWQVSTMMTLGLLMAAVFLFLFFGPYKRLRRAIRPPATLLVGIWRLMGVSLALGVATVVVASLGHY